MRKKSKCVTGFDKDFYECYTKNRRKTDCARGISAVRQETKMGIAIQELLSQEYFKDFFVLAGAKGLHREIQGITVMEAPDAFHWTKGKELVLSSGYVIAKEPDCIEKAFREGSIQKSAGMMIKRERYLEKIP